MKRIELFFMIILVPVDYFMLVLAGTVAYFLRFVAFAGFRPIIFELNFSSYSSIVLVVALAWLLIFALAGLYTVGGRRERFDEFRKIILACSTGFAVLLAIIFFSRELFASRFIVLVAWILAIIFVTVGRFLIRGIELLVYERGSVRKLAVIIGQNKNAQILKTEFNNNKKLGIKVLGCFDRFDEVAEGAIKKFLPFDDIYFVESEAGPETIHRLLDFANEQHVTLKYSADIFSTHAANLEFFTITGLPLIEVKRTRLEGWGSIYKRVFDLASAFIFIIIFGPLMIVAALLLFLESGFPMIYRNIRIGLHGKPFDTLKFRSMYKKYCIGKQFLENAEALAYEEKLIKERGIKVGPVYKIKDDPRVTPLGLWLRRWSIDEFPQFFNVLWGEMSIIGPRPHQPREVAKYETHHKKVLDIRPGITGLAQVSGRSDLEFEEEVRLDTYYIEHWSFKLDLIILFKTIFAAISKKGAY